MQDFPTRHFPGKIFGAFAIRAMRTKLNLFFLLGSQFLSDIYAITDPIYPEIQNPEKAIRTKKFIRYKRKSDIYDSDKCEVDSYTLPGAEDL